MNLQKIKKALIRVQPLFTSLLHAFRKKAKKRVRKNSKLCVLKPRYTTHCLSAVNSAATAAGIALEVLLFVVVWQLTVETLLLLNTNRTTSSVETTSSLVVLLNLPDCFILHWSYWFFILANSFSSKLYFFCVFCCKKNLFLRFICQWFANCQ